MVTLTEPEKAYIAGLWDGEGSILVGMKNSKIKDMRVSIAMTNHEVINKIYKLVNLGSVNDNFKSCRGYRICYKWTLSNNDGAKLLDVILPYLIVKRLQAQLYIELCGMRTLHGTKANLKVQLEIARSISNLNRIGVVSI